MRRGANGDAGAVNRPGARAVDGGTGSEQPVREMKGQRHIASPRVAAEGPAPLAERLTHAQRVFDELHAKCFWSWDPRTRITEEMLPSVAHALRTQGGRREFLLSTKPCPSTTYRELYLPRYAGKEAPKAA